MSTFFPKRSELQSLVNFATNRDERIEINYLDSYICGMYIICIYVHIKYVSNIEVYINY